jgi:palmitoyl transferase
MKVNLIIVASLLFSLSAHSQDQVDCVDCVVRPSTEAQKIIGIKKDVQKISEYSKTAPRSKWMAAALSKAECTAIIKEIDKGKLTQAIVPEIQSAIDIIKSECGVGEEPEVIVREDFPFTIAGTNLFLSWTENKKLSVEVGKKEADKKENYRLFTKVDLEKGALELTADQKKIIDRLDAKEHVDKSLPSQSYVKRWWNATKGTVSEIMTEGDTEVYLPMMAYHDRNTYTPDKIKELNEGAYGLGVGKTKVNEKGNTEMLYVMSHLDSHGDVETNAGYGWVKKMKVVGDVKVGIGYAAGLVSRSDIAGRIPVPFAFPMGTIDVGNASINAILIPKLNGGLNHGNVLFIFGKYTWEKKKK